MSWNSPQFVVIHIVKGFGIVNKAEVDVFLELSCLFHDPVDVGNLISGSSVFSKSSLNIWRILDFPILLFSSISLHWLLRKTASFLHSKAKFACYSRYHLTFYFCIPVSYNDREGNGTPLQYSCLESPMDGVAWWAAVYGVAQSRTPLRRFSSSSSPYNEKDIFFGC